VLWVMGLFDRLRVDNRGCHRGFGQEVDLV
jgi:hypothetical protein